MPVPPQVAGIFLRTCARWRADNIIRKIGEGRELGKPLLSSLQSGTRTRPQIGGGLHVCANRGNPASAKIGIAANLLLSAVLCLAGHGPAAGRRSQHRGVANDARSGRVGPRSEPGGLGDFAGRRRFAAGNRDRGQRSPGTRGILRVLKRRCITRLTAKAAASESSHSGAAGVLGEQGAAGPGSSG